MPLSFDDLGGGCDDFDAHNRRVQRVIPKPLWNAFEEEVQMHIRAGKSRYDAEKAVLDRCEAAMHREFVFQERRKAQEDGTFGTVEAQPQPAPIRAALPAKVEEIPADFGLPDKEYITGKQICAKAEEYRLCSRATIQSDMRTAAGRAKPKRSQRSAADPDHGNPYIFDRAKAIEILLNRLDRVGQKIV